MPNDVRQQEANRKGKPETQDKEVIEGIVQALSGLRFGSVEIVVHEGKVTQIERKEKFRLG
jgi:hypothetical protein